MYSYDSAIGKSFELGRWTDADIGEMKCYEIFVKYQGVYAVLSNPAIPNLVCLNLNDIRSQIVGLDITFNQFLIDNGNATLPTTNKLPEIKVKVAKYNDAFRAGYKVFPFDPNSSLTSNVPNSERDWIMVKRQDTDFKKWYESILPTVNGFYHPTSYDVNGGYIIDGMKTKRVSDSATIGFHSFESIGKIEIIRIKPEMITPTVQDNPLFDNAVINTGKDLSTKTVLLSIGGYLFAPGDQAYGVNGERTVAVQLKNTPFLERFYESRQYLDFSSLPISPFPTNEDMYLIEELIGDENIRAYLSLTQSFVILIDKTDIYTETHQIRTAKMPGVFTSYAKPEWPMLVGEGMMSNYWATQEGPNTGNHFFNATQWSLTCVDGFVHKRLMNTNDPFAQNAAYPNRNPMWPVRHSFGTFLKICLQTVF